MFRSFRLGTLFGFPIEVSFSFLLLLGLVALTMGGAAAVFVALVAFASVVAHELGHALVARHLGVRVASIELHFFGGAARLIDAPRRPGDEIAIAAAGPAVSFALGGFSLLLASATGAPFFGTLAWINLAIGAFNLVPALPMDGGRILRALLQPRLGHLRATEVAVLIARVFAVALAVFAVVVGHLYLAALAVMLWLMSSAELQAARYRASVGVSVGDVEVLPRRAAWGRRTIPGRGAFVVRLGKSRITVDPID